MKVTDGQRQSKQRFWRVVKKQNTNADPSKLTSTQIARLAGDIKLVSFLADPEFYEWFMEEKSEEDLLKAGAENAIRCLMDIISGNQEVKSASAQVTAAKILLEMAGYGPKQSKEVVYKDEQIAKMSEDELKEFISKQSEHLN